MDKLYDIYRELYDNGIFLFDTTLPFSDAAVIELDGTYGMFVDTSKLETFAAESVAVAHEAGHIFTGSTHNVCSPYAIIAQHETRANRWAIKKLLPFDELKEVMESGITQRYELAEHFGVTEDFVQSAFNYYFGACGFSFPE